jgi:hypothetical protein
MSRDESLVRAAVILYFESHGSEGKEHFAVSGHPQFVLGGKAVAIPVELKTLSFSAQRRISL